MPSPQLLVKFPSSKQWPGWHFSEYLLTNIDLGSPSTPSPLPPPRSPTSTPSAVNKLTTIIINPHTSADYLADASVFTGTAPSSSAGPERTFAMKFAFRQDLIASLASEASVYVNHLHSLQGSVVPKFYGLFFGSPVMPRGKSVTEGFGLGMFSGEDGDSCGSGGKAGGSGREGRYVQEDDEEEDKGVAACLVLEWWGRPVNRPFHVLPVDTRFLIIDQLAALHRAGLYHGDFAERNVLMQTTTRAKPVSKPTRIYREKSRALPAPPRIHTSSPPSSTSHPAKQPEKSNSGASNSSESSCASSFFNLSVSECSSATECSAGEEDGDEDQKTHQPTSSRLAEPDTSVLSRPVRTPSPSPTSTPPVASSTIPLPEVDPSSEPKYTLETVTEIRLIDFDIVIKHDFPCLACDVEEGRDFTVPFFPGNLADSNALEKTTGALGGVGGEGAEVGSEGVGGEAADVKRVHWGGVGHYPDEEEEVDEEDENTRAGREFGCEQMYDVCKHVMRVWG